jgi:hypothetical protein
MFFNVVVGGKSYGDIAPGARTGYQTWAGAYSYSSVSLVADSQERKVQVIDHMGEARLGKGHFTYVLTYNGGRLGIRAERDDKPGSVPAR